MKKLLLFFLPLAALLAGCEKEGILNSDQSTQEHLVASIEIISSEGKESFDFKYDKNGRLTDMIESYNGHEYAHNTFIYSDKTIMMTDSYNNNDPIEWKLNNKGLINEQQILRSATDTQIYNYYYDDNNLLNDKDDIYKYIDYDGSEHFNRKSINFHRENGNVVRVDHEYANVSKHFTFTDYTNKANIDFTVFFHLHYPVESRPYPVDFFELDKNSFISLGNKNLPKSMWNDKTPEEVTSFSYKFNQLGYVIEINESRKDGSTTYKINYAN